MGMKTMTGYKKIPGCDDQMTVDGRFYLSVSRRYVGKGVTETTVTVRDLIKGVDINYGGFGGFIAAKKAIAKLLEA